MRNIEELVLDGNAAGGMLAQIFLPEMTRARVTCMHCASEHPLGAARLFDAAGVVLRCTECSGVLLRVVDAGDRTFIDLTGIRRLELRMQEPTA
jgi:hypothetical protein